jgi:hypothetical protein
LVSAIYYSSQTGHTRQYARLLAEALSLPWYDMARRVPAPKSREVIYMGWLFAGKVKGYEKAAKENRVKAVCATGMSPPSDKLTESIRAANKIPADVPVFYMQGGFNMKALPLPLRGIMYFKNKSIAAGLRKVDAMNAHQAATFRMTQKAYSAVDRKNLDPVIAWYNSL